MVDSPCTDCEEMTDRAWKADLVTRFRQKDVEPRPYTVRQMEKRI